MDAEVAQSSFRHGVGEQDILHAYRNPIAAWRLDEFQTIRVGATMSGELLEIGVSLRDDHELIVHAMPTRPKYFPGVRDA